MHNPIITTLSTYWHTNYFCSFKVPRQRVKLKTSILIDHHFEILFVSECSWFCVKLHHYSQKINSHKDNELLQQVFTKTFYNIPYVPIKSGTTFNYSKAHGVLTVVWFLLNWVFKMGFQEQRRRRERCKHVTQ